MDVLNLANAIFKQYGVLGLVVAYIAYKNVMPIIKKKQGTWVSYKELEKQITKLKEQHEEHVQADIKVEMEFRLMKAAQDEINKNMALQHERINDLLDSLRERLDNHFAAMLDAIRKGGR